MSEVYSHSRAELDAYEKEVVEMAHRFGSSFYKYNRDFSSRVELLLANYDLEVDWSQHDTKLFTTIFAGQKVNRV